MSLKLKEKHENKYKAGKKKNKWFSEKMFKVNT